MSEPMREWSPRGDRETPELFTDQELAGLLITAWEGGSNYWILEARYIPPRGMTEDELRRAAWRNAPSDAKELWSEEGPEGRWPLYSLLPFLPETVKWKIKFIPDEGERVFLTPKNMRAAAKRILTEYPEIFRRIKDGQYDANDADVWLQMSVFGEIVYG